MKTTFNFTAWVLLILFLTVLSIPRSALADTVRKPVWAGLFYESDPSALAQSIDQLTRKAQKTRLSLPKGKRLRAIILPHAGYVYSGWTAAHAARVLSPNQFSKVILLGPDHRIGIQSAAICDATAYQTPLGKIHLHKDTARLRLQPDLFETLPASRDREHSLEVLLPFLQRYLHEFQLVPVVVGHGSAPRLAQALDSIMGGDTLLVISSDLSHFLSYAEALVRDRETIDEIINLRPNKLVKEDNRACGKIPLLILTEMALRHHWQPLLLHYANSGDTAGDRSRVVGYAAVTFWEEVSMEKIGSADGQFSEAQGQVLVNLARKTIGDKLGLATAEPASQDLLSALKQDCFQVQRGTFVTLKIKGQLRGCIGSLTAMETVAESVRRNALNAAFQDPRFPPLSQDELDLTSIEVSILTEARPLRFQDGQDLIKKLRPHVDGVIIRQGFARATFLPQVWEQLPKPEEFLAHLCMKAGLPSRAWEDSDLEVLTYQVQYFEENR
jgi:AmmeMemoRadiSam system protein B/AmmeMemoRadiSam system protein A